MGGALLNEVPTLFPASTRDPGIHILPTRATVRALHS